MKKYPFLATLIAMTLNLSAPARADEMSKALNSVPSLEPLDGFSHRPKKLERYLDDAHARMKAKCDGVIRRPVVVGYELGDTIGGALAASICIPGSPDQKVPAYKIMNSSIEEIELLPTAVARFERLSHARLQAAQNVEIKSILARCTRSGGILGRIRIVPHKATDDSFNANTGGQTLIIAGCFYH